MAEEELDDVDRDQLLDDGEAEALRQEIGTWLAFGKQYWWPLHARMDFWMSMYLMLDVIQQMKPYGFRRFVSNEPRTAVDRAVSILTRNDSFWRIDLSQDETENPDQRRLIGKIERTLQGIVYDMDELFSMQFQPPLWKQVAYQALLRGWIWGKAHVTTAATKYRSSPLISEIYDARLVVPHFDQFGLNKVAIEKHTTVGDLASIYPEVFERERRTKAFNPAAPAIKIEFWSNSRGEERPGIMAALAIIAQTPSGQSPLSTPIVTTDQAGANGRWIIRPRRHGYDPDSLPVVGVPVNGLPIQVKPSYGRSVYDSLEHRGRVYGFDMRLWHAPNTAVAESGRSILSSIEEQLPQFNELIATIFQHFSMATYPTKIFHTQTGELPEFEEGINARIPMRPEESVENLLPAPINTDAYRLLDILKMEQEKGTLSPILQASAPLGDSSGTALSQLLNSALNALEPFHDGMEQFGTRMGTSVLAQMQAAAGELEDFSVSAPERRQSFVSIHFSPKDDLISGRKYRARPIFRPALPDDLHIRIQSARIAVDPARPVLSLLTALERIIQVEDPAAEADRIWEDIANRDPVIVLEQIAQALERLDELELANRIREAEFKTRFIEDLAFRQQTGAGLPQGNGRAPQLGPESGAPGSTQRTSSAAEQEMQQSAQEGAEMMGVIGGRGGV